MNQKMAFSEWLQNRKKGSGEQYSKAAADNYIKALETYCEKLTGLNLPESDLFEFDSLTSFDAAKQQIISHPDYDAFNKSFHRIFSSALVLYSEFLAEKEYGVSLKDEFSDWLNNYPDHKYIPSTIKRYLVALERAEERLNIRLHRPIWFISDQDDFENAYNAIVQAESYPIVNKKFGNGDLSAALSAYRKFLIEKAKRSIGNPISDNSTNWSPSLAEYFPGISKTQWLTLLRDPNIIGPVWGAALAMFFTEKDGATCSVLGKKFNRHPTSLSGNCTQLAKRIYSETSCPLYKTDEGNKYWPILFLGRKADSNEPGTWIWKLRPELYEALKEFDILRFLPNEQEHFGVFDSWEIIDETTAIKTCDKSFFEHNGSGVPKGICWFFGADSLPQGEKRQIRIRYLGTEYAGLIRNESTDRLRTRIFWNADLAKRMNEFKNGSAVRAKFIRTAPDEYELTMETEGAEKEMTVREAIDGIKNYIAARGFTYADGLIENFYLSLKSKPFVILAGTSGTGKTKLVKLFAEAIGATAENGRYKLVPVRPDWSDSTDLFGHVDLNNNFHAGAILDFLKEAESHPDKPYFLCLDEMNLARVEYYLSDILSVIETREKTEDGRVVSVPLISEENYGGDTAAEKKYGTVRFPENLCLIGTVNMDETTFPFSKKVLDRANTIEFSDVDLIPDFESFEIVAEAVNPGKLFLKPEYLQISHCKAQREYIQKVCESLQALNTILAKANAHVGYRVRDEICFYMLNNRNSGLLPEDTAMDNEIMQKILPRIQGSSNQIREMLCALFKFCAGDYTGYDNNSDSEAMKTYLQNKGGKYRSSAEKIMSMVRRFDEDGFTSYWI